MEIKLVLPDTNILIPALGRVEPYASFLEKLIRSKNLAISVITASEFLVKARVDEEKIFNALLQRVNIFSIDLPIAQLGAAYRKKYLEKGKKISLPDCFIAATCKIHRVTLATLNKKDYPMEDFKILDKFK